MSRTKVLVLLAGAGLGLAAAGASAQQVSNDEVRAMVAEVMRDAETRSSLLQGGGSAGHDDMGFYVGSSDNSFRLNVGGEVQFRYYASFRDDNSTVSNDDFEGGFVAERTALKFHGHIVDPAWTYYVRGNFDRDSSGSFNLEDAIVGYNWGNGWKARWGQFKPALMKEIWMEDYHQMAVDRALTTYAFAGTQLRTQGIELGYFQEDWTLQASFNDGLQSGNTDFINPIENDYGLTGRFQYKFAGAWEDFNDYGAGMGQAWAALLGAGVHWQQSRNTNAPTDVDIDYLTYTIDLTFKGDRWGASGIFYGNYAETSALGASDVDTSDFGAVAQLNYRILENTDLFFRYDGIFLDEDRTAGDDDEDFHFVTFGFNQYIAGHAAKFTMDAVVAFDETAALQSTAIIPGSSTVLSDTRVGLLGDSEDTEVVIRGQFQLLF